MAYAIGEFEAEVLSGMLTESSEKKTLQVAVEFRLLEGPNNGSRITDYLAVTDNALPYTVEKLRTCGWQGEDLEDLSTIGGGTVVRLVLKEEEYKGKTRTKVAFINKAGPRSEPAPKGVGQQWRDRIRALSGAAAAPGKAPF